MRTGLLLLLLSSCALASLFRLNAEVGDRVELYLGNRTKTWCRQEGTCYPFSNSNSTLQSNGSLIFKSVQESDSGTYYSLEVQKPPRTGKGGPMTLVADAEIVLTVKRPIVTPFWRI
ncbi:hypothetical protein GCK32_003770 [Trichostrongylus colubriformis]|uniref:Uncharacterized protein n=1 Tax=Trichostrongylus colubriformis TaxID=6319 RepID=A0AAN8J1V9_TRICO